MFFISKNLDLKSYFQYGKKMNSVPPITHGDVITNLPTDGSMPSHEELQIINSIFRENKATKGRLFSEAKEGVILIMLFIILSIEPVDKLLKKIIPIASSSPYILILIKGIILAVVFYMIKNLYLVKTN